MNSKKVVISLVMGLLIVMVIGLGGYYYYSTVKSGQTGTSSNKTKTQIPSVKPEDTIIKNSPEPVGIAQPKYQAAPTPPTVSTKK